MKHIYLIWCLCLQDRYIMKLCLLAIGFVLLLSIDEGESWLMGSLPRRKPKPICKTALGLKCRSVCFWCPPDCRYTYRTCSRRRKKRNTEVVSSINRQIHTYSTYMCILFSLHTNYTPFSFVLWLFCSFIQDIRKTSAFVLYVNMW
jgi:hypothetical protein